MTGYVCGALGAVVAMLIVLALLGTAPRPVVDRPAPPDKIIDIYTLFNAAAGR